MSKLVTQQTAQLAQQFGFAGDPLPTQDALQSWLESEKGMYVSCAPEMYVDGINWNWQVLWYRPKELWTWHDQEMEDGSIRKMPEHIYTGTGYYGDNGEFPTRHEAIEAALQMALLKTDPLFRNNSIEGLAEMYGVDRNEMLNRIRPFSKELGDWTFREFTISQLKTIVSKLGEPPIKSV